MTHAAIGAGKAPAHTGRVEFGTLGTLKEYTVWFTGERLQLKFDKWLHETTIRVPASQYIAKSPIPERRNGKVFGCTLQL